MPDTVDGTPPLTWSSERQLPERQSVDGNTVHWTCAQCTRRFVRSIEAKLDHEWW